MRYQLIVFFVFCNIFTFVGVHAQEKPTRVVYKWTKNGQVNYSYIKPLSVKNFIKLDGEGLEIKEISEDFDEIVKIKRLPEMARPEKKESFDPVSEDGKDNVSLDEELNKSLNKRNCNVSRSNLEKINREDAYMQNDSGDLFKLDRKQIEQQRQQIEKDILYYCSE